eukprot:272231-Chlamydomonas_euryale.AAC.7
MGPARGVSRGGPGVNEGQQALQQTAAYQLATPTRKLAVLGTRTLHHVPCPTRKSTPRVRCAASAQLRPRPARRCAHAGAPAGRPRAPPGGRSTRQQQQRQQRECGSAVG